MIDNLYTINSSGTLRHYMYTRVPSRLGTICEGEKNGCHGTISSNISVLIEEPGKAIRYWGSEQALYQHILLLTYIQCRILI